MKGKNALFMLTAGVLAVVALTGCGKKSEPKVKDEVTGISFSKAAYGVGVGGGLTLNAHVQGTGNYDTSVTYSIPASDYFDLEDGNFLTASEDAANQKVVVTATAVGDTTKTATATVTAYDLANGYADYSNVSNDERANILGVLEKYAIDTHLAGLTIMGNGGYVMYADGITKGTNTYIPGYGFGILAEGAITKPLTGSGVQEKYNLYYHTFNTSDPASLMEMDSKESDVSDLVGYVTSGYFDTQMNRTKDGYDWVGDLAKVNRPIPLDLDDETGKATTFKFPVKVGEEVKYATNTSVPRLAAFNNRPVALEDYITPYQIYYTKAYGLKRSEEQFGEQSELLGTEAYFNASEDGFNQTAWDKVGIKAYVDEDDGLSYLQFTFKNACTPFYAMYYLAGGMFTPVPQSFILECAGAGNTDLAAGVKAWGRFSGDGKETAADHFLSTGAFVCEEWNSERNIVFKKNPNYADRGRYQIPGVHINILAAANDDPEAGFKEFLAGNLSATGIPSTQLAQYKNDPRTTKTSSSSNFKLNMNTCDAELWDELFGLNGSVAKNTTAWDVKPAMSNVNFLNGLNYSLDRVTFCDKIGRTVACDFFSDNYMIDPENGKSWNMTQQHKDAMADMLAGTDGYGYSLELAKASFKKASEELIANGDYDRGETVKIELCWMYESDKEDYAQIPQDIEKAFNSCGGGLQLKIDVTAVSTWSDVYYKKMMIGMFDIAFGSISGNPYDPLGFLDVLMSSNPNGFTLNWGVDTGEVDGSIIYDNKAWSFDSLYYAATTGAILENGQQVNLIELYDVDMERLANGDLVVYLWADFKAIDEGNFALFAGLCIYATTDDAYSDYSEYYVTNDDTEHFYYDEEEKCYVIIFDAEVIAEWLETFPPEEIYAQGFDIHVVEYMNGKLVDPRGYGYYYLNEEKTVFGAYYTGFSAPTLPEIPSENP